MICVWSWVDKDINLWRTTCNYEFVFKVDGPENNEFNYCPKCGNSITANRRENNETKKFYTKH